MTGLCMHGRGWYDACAECAALPHERARERDALRLQRGDLASLTTERDELRRELSQFDCRRTGGPVSDVGGVHCPPGSPCMRCQLAGRTQDLALERRGVEALALLGFDVEALRSRAETAEARLAKVDAAAAEMVERVKHLVWVASGAPMLGEELLT